jgi:hypothetical protein
MVKKEVLLCTTLITIGTLDWLTTLVGVMFFGATETNPLLTNLTQTNILLFSTIKLTAIMLTGLLFYKAEIKTKLTAQISPFTKKFLNSGYVIALFFLMVAVLNNFATIVNVT